MSKEDIVVVKATTVVLNAETAYIRDHVALYEALLPTNPQEAGKELDKVIDEKTRTRPDRHPDHEEEWIKTHKKGKKK